MSARFRQVIESINELSASERALVAHCLISSLESSQEEDVDKAWLHLAEKRYVELESGEIKGMSWEEIKGKVKAGDA